jgi:iron complex transport system substrate-binding protein
MNPHRRRVLRHLGATVFFALGSQGCRRSTSALHETSDPPERRAAPQRIVSLSPNTTEALFSLGAGHRVVGRSRFCDYPPEVTKIPSVGGYVDASLEAILALAPDLVVGARGPAGPALVEKLNVLGVATFFPVTESMAQIDSMLEDLGARIGDAAEGRRVVEELRARREAVRRAVQDEPVVRVLLLFGLVPVVAAGPQSFANEMILLARGANVVASGGAYPTLSVERILTLAPDILIDAANMTSSSSPRDLGARDDSSLKLQPGLRELAAVKEGRVAALKDEAVLRPGPRIGDGLATMARAIHPRAVVP